MAQYQNVYPARIGIPYYNLVLNPGDTVLFPDALTPWLNQRVAHFQPSAAGTPTYTVADAGAAAPINGGVPAYTPAIALDI